MNSLSFVGDTLDVTTPLGWGPVVDGPRRPSVVTTMDRKPSSTRDSSHVHKGESVLLGLVPPDTCLRSVPLVLRSLYLRPPSLPQTLSVQGRRRRS